MRKLLLLLLFTACVSNGADAPKKKAPTKPKVTAKKAASKKSTKKKSTKKKTVARIPGKSFLNQLPAAERKKLIDLYRKDPKAFQREIRNRSAAWKRKISAKESKETYALIRAYQRERDAKKKAAIKQQLTALTSKQFSKRLKDNKSRIVLMEKKLKDLKKKCEWRSKNANKIVEERVRYLTSDPNLRW